MKKFNLLFAISIFILIFAASCGVYSFTGASIPPNAKTIDIAYFPNYAALVQASLSQKLTEKLKDKFANQTSLNLVNRNGDLHLEGAIIDYQTAPNAILANETAATNRLTITIKVKFVNNIEPKQNFETTFSRYADYASNKNLTTVEGTLIDEIVEMLVDDIFNKSVVNW